MSDILNRRRMYYHVYIQWLAHHNILEEWMDGVIDSPRALRTGMHNPYAGWCWETEPLVEFLTTSYIANTVQTQDTRFTGWHWYRVVNAFVNVVLRENKLMRVSKNKINKAVEGSDRT